MKSTHSSHPSTWRAAKPRVQVVRAVVITATCADGANITTEETTP